MPLRKIVKQQQSAGKVVPKKKEIPPLEEDNVVYEDEEVEEKPLSKIRKKLPVAQVEVEEPDDEGTEEEVEEEPKRKKKGSLSLSALAQAFKSVPLSASAQNVKAGIHEAIVRSIVLQEPNDKGQSVRINVDLCSPEFEESNQLVDWRMIMNVDGEGVGGGIRALANDLAMLGYEIPEADDDFDENLKADFAMITREKPGVLIKVFYQNANGVDYMHFRIHGEASDNPVIEEYRDQNPY